MMRTLTLKAGCGCRFTKYLVAPSMNVSSAIHSSPSSPKDVSVFTSSSHHNLHSVSNFSAMTLSPSMNVCPSSLNNIAPSIVFSPPRRQLYQSAFPRRGKKFLDAQEALRKSDGVPEGAELIFLRPREWSDTLPLSMDIVTVTFGCYWFFWHTCPPEYMNECLVLKSVSFLLVFLFIQRRMSAFCQRIYLLEPDIYFAVFPRYFLPKRVIQYRVGEVTLKNGVLILPGEKKMYCSRKYFASYDVLAKMLNLKLSPGTK